MGYQTGKSKQAFKTDYGITYCYKKYISHYCVKKGGARRGIKVNNKYNMSLKEYGEIIKACNLAVMNLIIKKGIDFKLPFRMGTMSVVKKKIAYLKLPTGRVRLVAGVDWKATHEMWKEDPKTKENKKVIYYTNEHSGGYTIRLRYLNTWANFTGFQYYRFYPTREFNKLLSEEIKTNMNFDAPLSWKYGDQTSFYDLTKYINK
jgi:hypothetical protein